ncbi:hypothetical protein [Paenibacillus aestuarii]|uniref:Uncharacterized protein n=1 Tax=Paenibacillus aestuarii TaxID=516965 RepID=A0ABW0K0Z8_9BACL|nr:hypothetical protein [Paenibacillus aestuarii]
MNPKDGTKLLTGIQLQAPDAKRGDFTITNADIDSVKKQISGTTLINQGIQTRE